MAVAGKGVRVIRVSRYVPLGFAILLFGASVALWLDGQWKCGRFTVEFPSRESGTEISSAGVAVFHGADRLCLQYTYFPRSLDEPSDAQYYRRTWRVGYDRWETQNLAPDPFAQTLFDGLLSWRALGYGLYDCGRQGESVKQLELPVWLFTVAGLAIAIPSMVRRASKKLRAVQTCARCGYDLRATPDRCPECGRAIPVQKLT